MITLQQLQEEIGSDFLLEICEALNIEVKSEYPVSDQELQRIREVRNYMKRNKISSVANAIASMSTNNDGSAAKRKTRTSKQAKTDSNESLAKNQAQGQSSLVANKTKIAQVNVAQGVKEGQQLAQQKARAMATAYLQTTADCYSAFANSIVGMEDSLLQIGDEAILNVLEGDADDFFALPPGEIAGSFSLTLLD